MLKHFVQLLRFIVSPTKEVSPELEELNSNSLEFDLNQKYELEVPKNHGTFDGTWLNDQKICGKVQRPSLKQKKACEFGKYWNGTKKTIKINKWRRQIKFGKSSQFLEWCELFNDVMA